MGAKSNLLKYIEIKGIKKPDFYKKTGLSNGFLDKNENISSQNIEIIISNYPDISIDWLVTGKGEMLKNNDKPVAKQTDNPNEGIPLIPIEAIAGALTCDNTILEYECDRYVVPMFKDADFLIPVKGSSMYPKYSSGDIVACQRISMNNLFFQWNKVYVLDTNQGALIKRIKPGHDENHILIVSDNEKYDPFELPYSAIHAVALVIGVIRLE